jgi:hypothetical protein
MNKRTLFVVCSAILCQVVYAEMLPSAFHGPVTNSLPWDAGRRGGIPSDITNWCNLVADYSADNTGAAECSIALSNAIAACPPGSAIYLPAGEYLFRKGITIAKSGVVIRGAGRESTIFKMPVTNGFAAFYLHLAGSGSDNTVTNGATRGSQTVYASTLTGISVGKAAVVVASNSTDFVWGSVEGGEGIHSQRVMVTNITGNAISFDRPLYATFTSGVRVYSRPTVTNVGIESLRIDSKETTVATTIFFGQGSMNCWAFDVGVSNHLDYGISIHGLRNTVKRCYVVMGSDVSAYGFQVTSCGTDNLIEDNVADLTGGPYLLQYGCSGNVVAYNFYARTKTNIVLGSQLTLHGSAANYNLFEGNIVQGMKSDNIWGCNHYNTFFRNWSSARAYGGYEPVSGKIAWNLEDNQPGTVTWGNVLLTPYDIGLTTNTSHWLYSLDYSGASTNCLLHLNYEWPNQAVQLAAGYTQAIPNSLYLSSKPSWFGNLAWPPIGPDVAQSTNTTVTNMTVALIPAQARWLGIDYTTNTAPQSRVSGTLSAGNLIKR